MSLQVSAFERTRPTQSKAAVKVEEIVGKGFDVRKFVSNFAALVDVTGGLKKLRELAIELATMGLLLEGSDRASWKQVSLADVVLDFQNGISKRRGDVGAPVPVLRLADIDAGVRLRDSDLREIVLTDAEQQKYGVKRGDILVIRVNGSGDLVGRFIPCEADRNWAYSDHLIRIRVRSELLDPAFLCAVSRSSAARAHLGIKTVTTAGQKTINQQGLGSLPLLLPPLAEQKRIVAKVDQLMALCDELEARQTKKREIGTRLTKSALEALTTAEGPEEFDTAWKRTVQNFDVLIDRAEKVGELRGAIRNLAIRGVLTKQGKSEVSGGELIERIEADRATRIRLKQARRMDPLPSVSSDDLPFRVPTSWSWTRLGNICWKAADGPHFSPKYVTKEEGVPFLSGRNIKVEGFELETVKYVSPEDHRSFCERTKPEPGDVLYTKGGTTGVALVNDLDFEFSVWVHVAVLKFDLASVFSKYVALALNSPHCYVQSQKLTHGTGNRDLGLTRMVLITLPLPPLEEQKRIVAKVEQLMKVCDDLEACLRQAEDRAAKLVEAAVQELVA